MYLSLLRLPSHTVSLFISLFFFFNDTATTEIYTLSLHDALPISPGSTPGTASGTSPWARPDRATTSSSCGMTRGADALLYPRDGHRVRAHTVARDAASGVGGVETDGVMSWQPLNFSDKEVDEFVKDFKKKARFYLDEPVSSAVGEMLEAQGYKVLTARTLSMTGRSDEDHAALCWREG